MTLGRDSYATATPLLLASHLTEKGWIRKLTDTFTYKAKILTTTQCPGTGAGFASEWLGATFCSHERNWMEAEQQPSVEGGKLHVTKGGNR